MERTARGYQQDYFQRIRRRTSAIQAVAPLALVVAALVDSALTATPLLSSTRGLALAAGIAALLLLMWALGRATALQVHGWLVIAMLCCTELSLAFIVTPGSETARWVMPVLLAIPLAASPFWAHHSRALASCLLCYACASVLLLRTGSDPRALWLFAGHAALFTATSLAIFRSIDRLRRTAYEFQVNLEHEAKHDALTGLLSRRRFLQLGETARHEAAVRDLAVSLCFLDLDHFKQVNDLHGHAAGDRALSRVAECMLALMPADALLARMGGEEFVMLLPGCNAAAAQAFAEKLRMSIQEQDVGGFALTVSAGVAEHRPGETLGQTLHRADVALLEAKQRGRNRVEVASS